MGAIERNGYRFQPEYSIINKKGAIHVYHKGRFVEEIKFDFDEKYPDHNEIEKMVDDYCIEKNI